MTSRRDFCSPCESTSLAGDNHFSAPCISKLPVFFDFIFLIEIITLLLVLKLTLGGGDVTKLLFFEDLKKNIPLGVGDNMITVTGDLACLILFSNICHSNICMLHYADCFCFHFRCFKFYIKKLIVPLTCECRKPNNITF